MAHSKQTNPKEVRITNFPTSLKTELNNIADNIGIQMGTFLKMKLREIADSYPPEMKRELKD